MIDLEDRQSLSQDIGVAHAAGARMHLACEIARINLRTLQSWKPHEGLAAGDGRPQAVRPLPSHALSDAERAELVRVANEPRFAAVPPARIVPMLADDGVYLASESSLAVEAARAADRCSRSDGLFRHATLWTSLFRNRLRRPRPNFDSVK